MIFHQEIVSVSLTRPAAHAFSCGIVAAVAYRLENLLPAAFVVPPTPRLQHQRSFCTVGDHEAINCVVQLATIPATLKKVWLAQWESDWFCANLVQTADQFLGGFAVLGVLQVVEPRLDEVAEVVRFFLAPRRVAVHFGKLIYVVKQRST